MKRVLVLSALDPTEGAGALRDVETLRGMGLEPILLLTAVTDQNDIAVLDVKPVKENYLLKQWGNIRKVSPVSAIKVGLVPTVEVSDAVRRILREAECPSVVDTPLVASSGGNLFIDPPRDIYAPLFPHLSLLTPNIHEAMMLTGEADAVGAGNALAGRCEYVLVKGGHGGGDIITDLLFHDGRTMKFTHQRSASGRRGTGCFLSSAIAGHLAKGGNMEGSVENGISAVLEYITGSRQSINIRRG